MYYTPFKSVTQLLETYPIHTLAQVWNNACTKLSKRSTATQISKYRGVVFKSYITSIKLTGTELAKTSVELQGYLRPKISSVQSLSGVWLFATPWTTARQASLSITNSRSPPKPISIVLVMPSNHFILRRPFSSCPQSFPASGSFQMSQLSGSGGQTTGVSASTSVPPMNTQDWSPLGWTGWISLQSKGLSSVFSNTIVQKHQFFGA